MTSAIGAWENRIVGNGEEAPASLIANERNWRTHPAEQRRALAEVLDRVGWVQSVVVNKNTGRLIDGHLRVELARERGEVSVPVVYVDLAEEEEALVLATLDPIAGMARTDAEMLATLLADIELGGGDLADLLASVQEHEAALVKAATPKPEPDTSPQLGGFEYRILIECADEAQQRALLTRFEEEGFKCQALIS
jgi:ParB-like chromosome segregation protein Spo0J